MIRKLAKSSTNTTKDMFKYLIENKVDVPSLLEANTLTQLGYLLDYLAAKDIAISYDSFNYTVWYENDSPQAAMFIRISGKPIISQSDNRDSLNRIGSIDNLKTGIVAAFAHLENPF